MKKSCTICQTEFETTYYQQLTCCAACKKIDKLNKHREYVARNIERIRELDRERSMRDREKRSLQDKQYREKNAEQISIRQKERYSKNKERINAHRRAKYQSDPAYRENRHRYERKYRLRKNALYRERLKSDSAFKLRKNISRNINHHLKLQGSSKKGESCLKYLPYNMRQLREHLEAQFESWMNWDNYGPASIYCRTWQIDHIVPQTSLVFDSLFHFNFLTCWALENLRPLEAIENIRKSNKILNQEALLIDEP